MTYRGSSARPGAAGRRPGSKSRGGGRRRGGRAAPLSVSDCSVSQQAAETIDDDDDEEEDSEYTSSYETESSNADGADVDGGKKLAKAKAAQPKKDEIVHFDWQKDMLLNSKYRVTKLLGDGTFGRVLLASDPKKDRELAVKVIRNVEKYIRNAKREAEILKDIREADSDKAAGCVRMFDTFWHRTDAGELFFCLAFEPLGASLYDLLKQNRFRGMWVQDIQSIAQQCLEALSFLHDGLSLTHTDLKLENVLLQSPEPHRPAVFPREAAYLQAHKSQQGKTPPQYMRPACTKIKLIDFGNATYELEHHSSIINTRQYRAPEVILATGWDDRSDLWSTGCILMELYTGELLFRTHESLEHLALMERVVEQFPTVMLENASEARRGQFATQETSGLRLHWPERASSATSERLVRQQRSLQQLVHDGHRSLSDFVASLLILEPARRPSASAALMHPFLYDRFTD